MEDTKTTAGRMSDTPLISDVIDKALLAHGKKLLFAVYMDVASDDEASMGLGMSLNYVAEAADIYADTLGITSGQILGKCIADKGATDQAVLEIMGAFLTELYSRLGEETMGVLERAQSVGHRISP